jgi:YidC/Oxa1 family membrane protein insertase
LTQITDSLGRLLQPIQNVLEGIVIFLYNNVIENYGIVIILLTIIVRIVLTPLTLSQTRSMAKMQRLQPQLQEIQKKNKGDKQKTQQETMEFYKKHNVNPLAGCLPLILQMPVFFALFRVLREPSVIITSVLGLPYIDGVANSKFTFLWLDLNAKDPYYILPILMVATMFLSTKLTSTSTSSSQQNKIMMYAMPAVFGVISVNLASGILIYWVTTNVWSIGQQWVVNKFIKRQAERQEEKEKEAKKEGVLILTEEEKRIIKKKRKKRKKKK